MMKDNDSLTPEMKLGLNLVKGAISVLNTDTAPQVILKNSIREIDLILKSGNEVLIDRCNGELSVKYRGVFESSGGRFFIVSSEVYKCLSFGEKWVLLRNMGLELYGVLMRNKVTQTIDEIGKAGLEYVVDKVRGK